MSGTLITTVDGNTTVSPYTGEQASTAVAAAAIATAADRVQTGLDVIATAADRVQTGLDAAATAADVVTTAASAASTGIGGALYANTTAGLAAVAEGEYFYVKNADGNYVEYQDLSGVATATGLVITGPDYVATAISGTAAVESSLSGLTPSFEAVPAATNPNVYDPDIATALNGQYVNNAGNAISSSTRYHFSGFVPGTPGQVYVIDALLLKTENWVIVMPNNEQKIAVYTGTTVGTFHSFATAVFSESDRKLTFTMPAGASYFVWNVRDTNSDPSTQQFADMRASTFVYNATAGTTDLFASYIEPTARKRKVAEFDAAPVTVIRLAGHAYIRHPYNNDLDIVRDVDISQTITTTHTGAVDFGSVMRVPKTTRPTDTLFLFNALSGTPYDERQIGRGGDVSPPVNINNQFIGGGHGQPGRLITSVGHGLTLAAVGDVGTDGAGASWVLVDVPSVDTLHIVSANTGTATEWAFANVLTGSTITFSAAGAKAFSASSNLEVNDLLQGHTVSLWLDGKQITTDGTYYGNRAEVRESYSIPNPADWLTQIIAEKGAATPRKLSSTANASHVDLAISYQFGRFGEMVTYYDHYVKQVYSRSGNGYFGGQQWQVLFRKTGSGDRINQYVPDLTGTAGGYDFTAIADIESNGSSVDVPKSLCLNTSNPASHYAQICKSSGGTPKFGFAFGYARHLGVGVPAVRATLVDRVFNISNVEKQYPIAVDSAAGASAVVGENRLAVCWNQYYDMTANPTYTCNNVVEYADGTVHWIIDVHATLAAVWIDLPDALIGRAATVIDSTNFTLHSAAVTHKGLRVSTSGGRGRAVVQIV